MPRKILPTVSRRRSFRPGKGEFDRLDEPDRSTSVTWSRTQFLRAAVMIEPEMYHGLEDLKRLSVDESRGQEFESALIAWLERHSLLADSWCRRWAVEQLGMMRDQIVRFPEIIYIFSGPDVEIEPPDLPDFMWQPQFETRASIECRFSKYLNSVGRAFESAGYNRSPEKRQADHYWWLAGYQVAKFSYNGIANAFDIPRHTIELGIARLSEEIKLTLRAPTTNRRAKRNDICKAFRLPDSAT